MHQVRYRRRFTRLVFFREWMAGRALRRRKPDFSRERPMVSIIGDSVSDAIRAEQLYERDILEFVRDRLLDPRITPREVAVDVGANIGNHSLFLADIFERVIAFEPNPLARSIMEINLALNKVGNVELRAVGLSDQSGTATLTFDPINLGAATSTEPKRTSAAARAVGRRTRQGRRSDRCVRARRLHQDRCRRRRRGGAQRTGADAADARAASDDRAVAGRDR